MNLLFRMQEPARLLAGKATQIHEFSIKGEQDYTKLISGTLPKTDWRSLFFTPQGFAATGRSYRMHPG